MVAPQCVPSPLPRRELRFLQAKPGKRVANFGQSCKPGDLLLQCG